jgi:hypothetical protein
MQCDINTISDMKQTLLAATKEGVLEKGAMSSTGESFDLTTAFFKRLATQVRNPDDVLAELEARDADLDKPFHQALRRELGEEVYVGNAKHYLLSSYTVKNTDALGGVEFVLRLAPADNVASTKEYLFRMNSDTSVESIGRVEGTIEGVGSMIQRALSATIRKMRSDKLTKVELDSQGDKDLRNTLKKMAQVDTVLNSRQNRNASSLQGYEKITNYVHGNIDSMKEMLGKLHVLGNSKASTELLAYYNQLLESMHPRFFNQMELFLKKGTLDTFGQVDWTNNSIHIDAVNDPSVVTTQSEAEVYIHEVVHTMTAWALRQKDVDIGPLRLQLNYAMEAAKAKTTWQNFLVVPESSATVTQIEQAKTIHNYIFTGKSNVDEFIAYTLTNPQVMAHMKTIKLSENKVVADTVFGRVMDFFGKALNVLTGRFHFRDNDLTVYDKINDLASKLGEVNNKHKDALKSMNPLGQMMEAIDNADEYLAGKIEDIKTKVKNTDARITRPAPDADLFTKSKFLVQVGVKAFTNPVYRGFIGLWASAWGLKPNGTLRELVSTFFERDEGFRSAEKLNLLSSKIDATRNSVINATSDALKKAFTRQLSVDEESALTRVLLNTNLATLRYARIGRSKRPDTQTRKLLTDKDYRKEQATKIKYKINNLIGADKERALWTIAQSVSLGYFMATGKAHIAQNFNADNIAKGYGTPIEYDSNSELSTLVDELASITAVEYVSAKDRNLVAELMATQKKGIDALTDAYEAYRTSSNEYLFKDTPAHAMAGHTMELLDDSIDLTIAPISKRHTLEQMGYVMRYKLEPKNGDVLQNDQMALFTTGTWGKAGRVRGTVGLGKLNAKGTTLKAIKRIDDPRLSDITHARDFAKISTKALELHQAMRNGRFDITNVDYGMAPVIDSNGRVTDFRYMMSKDQKEELLGQDLRVTQVLARSMGNITHQIGRDQLNSDALQEIKEDMKKNWAGGTIGKDRYTEYSLIGPDATDPNLRELYAMLPETYQKFIKSRADKTMAVRSDLLRVYFGEQNFKLSNAPGIKLLPPMIKNIIDIVEGVWQELVKLSKGAILLKMPLILVSNLISNVRYQLNTGNLNIVELAKDYRDSAREVNEYLTYNRKANTLRLEIGRDQEALKRVRDNAPLKNKITEKRVELARLEAALALNPAKELFDAGLYQSHIEDIDNSALDEANRLTKHINSKLDKAPPLVRGAIEIAYLTQNTAWYKFSQEALQRTDMITRLVDNKRESRRELQAVKGEVKLPRWWLTEKREYNPDYADTKKLTGNEAVEFLTKAKTLRLQTLLDSYINYTLPNGKFEEYLNSMGVLMFTKYLKRIQPVASSTLFNHPLKTALTLLTAGAFHAGDIIQDQALIARGFDPHGEFSFSNMIPVYSPLYHLHNIFVPPIVKDEFRMGLF